MSNTTVGIDIGYDTLKIVGLKRAGNRFRLVGMGVASIPADSWTPDELKNREEIAKVIKDTVATTKPSPLHSGKGMIALPESVIYSGTFSMPQLSDKELSQAIPFTVADKLSINIDDYAIDFEKITSKCRPNSQIVRHSTVDGPNKSAKPEAPTTEPINQATIFAVAAKHSLIDSIVDLFDQINLELAGIGIKPGAVVRTVVDKNDGKIRMIIDIGATATSITVAEGKSVQLTSSIPIGARSFEQLPAIKMQSALEPVWQEILHASRFFENRICPGFKVEEVILTGGGANVPGILPLLKSQIGLPTSIGNPLVRLDTGHYPINLATANTFPSCFGLAMRELND